MAKGRRMRSSNRKSGNKKFIKKSRYGAKAYHAPSHVKRVGQIMRIYNSAITGQPTVLSNDGNGSISVSGTSADTAATVQFGGAMRFMLKSVIESSDLTQLFDRYKIKGVKLKFLYQSNLANSDSTTGTNALPIMSYSFDGDDDTNPTSYTDLARKQYTKQKILNGNYFFSIYLKPRVTKEVYRTALTTGYTSEKACWLDCNNDDIAHFGLKLWINNWNPGSTKFNQLSIQPTYYLALKDTQ